MHDSSRKPRSFSLSFSLILVGIGAILWALWIRTNSPQNWYYRTAAAASAKQIAVGHFIYASEHDDRLPPADQWGDLLEARAIRPEIFRLETSYRPKNWYFWGFPTALGGRALSSIHNPERTVLVYESASGTKNAHGGREDLAPPRKFPRAGSLNIFGFANASARAVIQEQVQAGTHDAPIWP